MDAARTDTQPHIFVSYRRTDKAAVLPIIRELERRGYRVWYDVEGIGPGKRISKEIERNIEKCAVFLAFLSEKYYQSDWCLDEIECALWRKKYVIPVKLDNSELKEGLSVRLARRNIIPYSGKETLIELIQGTPECEQCRTASPPETGPTPEPPPPPEHASVQKLRKKPISGKNLHKVLLVCVLLIVAVAGMVFAKAPLDEWMESRRILNERGWIVKNGVLTISKPYYGEDSPAPWAEYRDEITKAVIKPGVPNIGTRAFYNFHQLETISIPDSVTYIGWYAFYGCTNLTSIIIPDRVTYIGAWTFADCDNLSTVYILGNPNSITIQDGAFYHAPAEIIYGPPPEDTT